MLAELFAHDKRLALANYRLQQAHENFSRLQPLLERYLAEYVHAHALDIKSVQQHLEIFGRCYAADLEQFAATRRYPAALGAVAPCARITYDLNLLVSCFTDSLRWQIAVHLITALGKCKAKQITVLGAGAGLELFLLEQLCPQATVTAYDLDISAFVRQRFPRVDLREQDFLQASAGGADTADVDLVLAVEILEHLPNWQEVLRQAHHLLAPQGLLLCTTATDIPQFDHMVNFGNTDEFVAFARASGFKVLEQKTFTQTQRFVTVTSRNDWFCLQKE